MSLLTALALAAASPADRPMAAWMQCLANAAERFAPSSEPTDVAADAAMGACSAEQGAVQAADMRSVSGGAARKRMAQVARDGRETLRRRVIARIVEIRARP